VNNHEVTFMTSSFSSTTPSYKYIKNTDGQIYAQPLYVHQMQITVGGTTTTQNVVYVATENNTVYAFNADTGSQLLQQSLNVSGPLGYGGYVMTEIAVPTSHLPDYATLPCYNIVPELGITGTPVIDVSVTPPVLWVVTKHEDDTCNGACTAPVYRQKLHGLNAETLQEIPGSPVVIDSTISADFNPLTNNQRAGLLAEDTPSSGDITANVVVSWASHCDLPSYDGFVIEFDYSYGGTSPGFVGTADILNTEAGGGAAGAAGIWMGGSAPAGDTNGNWFLATGNGADSDQDLTSGNEFSNSVIRVDDTGLQDFYSPPDYHYLNVGNPTNTFVACANSIPLCPTSFTSCTTTSGYCQVALPQMDYDLGAGGVILLKPTFDTYVNHPEMIAAGKQGMVYVLFAGGFGGIDSASSSGISQTLACTTTTGPPPTPTTSGSAGTGAVVQCFQGITIPSLLTGPEIGNREGPAFLAGGGTNNPQNYLYFAGISDEVRAYNLMTCTSSCEPTFNTTAVLTSSHHNFGYPGAAPSITWNSSESSDIASNAILWVLDTSGYAKNTGGVFSAASGAILYAYKAIPDSTGNLTSLWDTSNTSNYPHNPGAIKFVATTVVDDHIFAAGGSEGYIPFSGVCQAPAVSSSGVYNNNPSECGGFAMYQ
jgi:hypothetical protein